MINDTFLEDIFWKDYWYRKDPWRYIFFKNQNTYFPLTNSNNPFFWGFFNREKETQKIKGARKLEVSSCFALVLENTERKGKAILNTTGLFSPKTMQYFTEYHDFGLRVFTFGIQDYRHFPIFTIFDLMRFIILSYFPPLSYY